MSVKISDIQYKLPKNKISIKKICRRNNWNYKKTVATTGIKFIYLSNKTETALSLAIKSCNKLKLDKSSIDGLIYVTQSPEYILPSTSCILQNKLKLKKDIIAFDINQGCSGFVQALFVAMSFLKTNKFRKILLICSDTYTKYIKKDNKSCQTIFSDCASSMIIGKQTFKKTSFIFGTDGSGSNNLIVKNSGSNYKKGLDPEIFMDGKKVLLFTMSNVPNFIEKILKKNNLRISDIKYFLFHQASKIVLDNLIRIMKLSKNKVYCNYEKIGNTVSSTIPVIMHDLIKNKKIKKGDKIIICGFGVGYSIAAGLLEF